MPEHDRYLCDVHETTLLVLNTETLSLQQEMVQDLLAIDHCFSARLYGLRNYRKALKKALSDVATSGCQLPVDAM